MPKPSTKPHSTTSAGGCERSRFIDTHHSPGKTTPYFLSLLAHNTWFPVHPPTIEAHGGMTERISKWTKAQNFVGNGPFTLKNWRLNDAVTTKRNPYYRQAGSSKTQRHPLRALPDTHRRARLSEQSATHHRHDPRTPYCMVSGTARRPSTSRPHSVSTTTCSIRRRRHSTMSVSGKHSRIQSTGSKSPNTFYEPVNSRPIILRRPTPAAIRQTPGFATTRNWPARSSPRLATRGQGIPHL